MIITYERISVGPPIDSAVVSSRMPFIVRPDRSSGTIRVLGQMPDRRAHLASLRTCIGYRGCQQFVGLNSHAARSAAVPSSGTIARHAALGRPESGGKRCVRPRRYISEGSPDVPGHRQ